MINEFTIKIITEFLEENYSEFKRFIELKDMQEEEAETILCELYSLLPQLIIEPTVYAPTCCRCGEALTTDEATCSECRINNGLNK